MALPQHMVFFCKELLSQVSEKFPSNANTVLADFLFGRWLLKDLCIEANKNGLLSEFAVTGALKINLGIVKAALTGLISSDDEFTKVMERLQNTQIRDVCRERRGQALHFLSNFAKMRTPTKTNAPCSQEAYFKIRTFTTSWTDISIIYDFCRAGSIEIKSRGLQLLLKDEFEEHDPDMLYSRFLSNQENSEMPSGGLSA